MKHFLVTVFSTALLMGCTEFSNPAQAPIDLPGADASIKNESKKSSALPEIRPQSREDSPPIQTESPVKKQNVKASTIASLGNPTEPGIWLKTPLVSHPQDGQVSYKGKSIPIKLIPIEGPETAGSRMSLNAFQALGAPLTELVELTVTS